MTSCCGLTVLTERMPKRARRHSDLVVPGGAGIDEARRCTLIKRYLKSFSLNTDFRIISICSGALLLAEAGVLDGRSATTHWEREQTALHCFPLVFWNMDRIYVRDGSVYTSAGVTTGIDLSLEIIREDCGGIEALAVARELVVSMKRSGGQTQYTDLIESQLCYDDIIAELISHMQSNPAKSWTL